MCDGLHIYAFYIGFQKHTPFSSQWLPPFMSTHIGDLLRELFFFLNLLLTPYSNILRLYLTLIASVLHLMLITFIVVLVCRRCVRI
jgi:hypothetical protein